MRASKFINQNKPSKEGAMFSVYEKLFLLCLHEEKMVLCPAASENFQYWLGGALLSDLALKNRIQVKEDHRVHLLSAEPTDDQLLDETLNKIQTVSNPKKVGYWMDDFEFKPKKVIAQLMEQMVAKGVLEKEDDDYSWVVPFPAENIPAASAKFNLRKRLRILLQTREGPDLQEVALLNLAKGCGMLDQVYFKDERRQASRLIYELTMSTALANPAAQSIQEIESALTSRVDSD